MNLLFHPYYPYHNYLNEVLQVYNMLMMIEMFQDLSHQLDQMHYRLNLFQLYEIHFLKDLELI
jgi:hypothetical protein